MVFYGVMVLVSRVTSVKTHSTWGTRYATVRFPDPLVKSVLGNLTRYARPARNVKRLSIYSVTENPL